MLKDSQLPRLPEDIQAWLETINDPVLIWTLTEDDQPDRIIEVNQIACDTSGYTREQLLRMKPQELVTIGSLGSYFEAIEELVHSGKVRSETEYTTAAGGVIPLETSASLVVYRERVCVMGIGRDVSRRRDAERELLEQKALYQRLVDMSPVGITVATEDGTLVFVNQAAVKMVRAVDASRVIGRSYFDYLHPASHDGARQRHLHSLRTGQANPALKSRLLLPDGTYFDAEVQSVRITFEGQLAMMSVIRDIRDHVAAERLISHMAYRDELTGLHNRRAFQNKLKESLDEARLHQMDLALMYLDMDNFKLFNDSFGHRAGDMLLKEMADRLTAALPPGTTVARLGGDEFTIILTGLSNTEDAVRIGEETVSVVAKSGFVIDGYEYMTTISMGITIFNGRDVDGAELLREADVAMYEAKARGGNGYAVFRPDFADSMRTIRHLQMQRALHDALDSDELMLVYQPKYSLQGDRVSGLEALLRWRSARFGQVSPNEFIPLAEESRLILDLGERVLRAVCRDLLAWDRQGLPPVRVSVNVSARQVQDAGFVGMVQDTLQQHGLSGERLEFEITERILMNHNLQTLERLQALKALGIQFAIDDFGVGWSSLAYLKRFPIDSLKIDQSFVGDLGKEPEGDEIVMAMIHLAHTLRLRVVAEGVETLEQQATLTAFGCDEVQGYLRAYPMPLTELIGHVKRAL